MTTTTQTKFRRPLLGTGFGLIVLGMASFLAHFAFDSFVKGMFLGAALALLVLGAYLVGQARWPTRDEQGEPRQWLPSRDRAPGAGVSDES